MNQRQLHARLLATRDLLLDISTESTLTAQKIASSEIDSITFFAYQMLTEQIHTCARAAAALAARTKPESNARLKHAPLKQAA